MRAEVHLNKVVAEESTPKNLLFYFDQSLLVIQEKNMQVENKTKFFLLQQTDKDNFDLIQMNLPPARGIEVMFPSLLDVSPDVQLPAFTVYNIATVGLRFKKPWLSLQKLKIYPQLGWRSKQSEIIFSHQTQLAMNCADRIVSKGELVTVLCQEPKTLEIYLAHQS